MNAKGRFISTLLVINSFFGGYALGFNNRHVLVVDPSPPPLVVQEPPVRKVEIKKEPETKSKKDSSKTKLHSDKSNKHEKHSKSKNHKSDQVEEVTETKEKSVGEGNNSKSPVKKDSKKESKINSHKGTNGEEKKPAAKSTVVPDKDK